MASGKGGSHVHVIYLNKVREAREAAAPKIPHHADALSFRKRRKRKEGGGINSWAVQPTGNYSSDYETGRVLAKEYLSFMGRYPTYGNRTLLGGIVDDMAISAIQRGQDSRGARSAGLNLDS